jgi:hypothetical protein
MEKVVKRKELMIETSNQIGVMAMIAALMDENGINIDAFSAYSSGDNAIVNLLTGDNEKAGVRLKDAVIRLKSAK